MNLLALETSSRLLSVALWRDGVILERCEDLPNAGSERLLPWVAQLMAEGGLDLHDLDALAYGAGPGGFVGLRLACSVAQGLAFGLDVPLLGIGSLEALALESGAGRVYACIDARMNEVYVGAFEMLDGEPRPVRAVSVHAPAAVPLPPGDGWLGVGDGFAAHGDALRERLGDALADVRAGLWPTAVAVARLAAPRLQRGEGLDAAQAAPLYVRDKVAFTTAERLARGGSK